MFHIPDICRQFVLIFALLLIFTSLCFGQANISETENLVFTTKNLEDNITSLKSYYAEAEAVVVFFIKAISETEGTGRQLIDGLKKYKDEWQNIKTKVLIAANGDLDAISHVMDGNNFSNVKVDDTVFAKCNVYTSYTLYVINVKHSSGEIIARFDAPDDIKSSKVDLAVQSCILSDYVIKASFDDKRRNNVFKGPDNAPLNGSSMSINGGIEKCEFSTDRRVGNQEASIEIKYSGIEEGDFNINLVHKDLSNAKYISMWVLGREGEEKFNIALKDGKGKESQLPVTNYICIQRPIWQRVSIPLTDFDLDLSQVSEFSLRFRENLQETVYIDDLIFYIAGDDGDGIHIIITESPQAGIYPAKGTIKGIVKGLNRNNIRNYQVVIYSETTHFYVQPWIVDPYTDITMESKWSANIHLGNKSYTAFLVQLRTPIFNIDKNFENDLNQSGKLSENLLKFFSHNNISLPQDAVISSSPDKQDSRWGITTSDPENPIPWYLIRKEGAMINIYYPWPTSIGNLPQDVNSVEIIDMDQVSPGFRRTNSD